MDKESFMAWKAVLFDMDGVLIDSEEYMAKTGVRALKKYGINAKESDFAEFVGAARTATSAAWQKNTACRTAQR